MIRKTGTFALLLAGLLLASCGNNAGTMASAVEVSAVEVRAEAAETDDKDPAGGTDDVSGQDSAGSRAQAGESGGKTDSGDFRETASGAGEENGDPEEDGSGAGEENGDSEEDGSGTEENDPGDMNGREEGEVRITVSAAGDVTMGNYLGQGYEVSFRQTYDQGVGDEYFFENVVDIFREDDLTLVNLEGPLTLSQDYREGQTYCISGDPQYVNILTAGSVEAVGMANNHRLDYKEQGSADTVAALKEAGILYAYDDKYCMYEVRGIQVGIVSVNEVEQGYGVEKFLQEGIAGLREEGADLVLASCHWGIEREYYPEDYQKSLGRKCIEWGADLVIGHHPHVLQGVEEYQGKYIVYSLGNFCFGANRNPQDKDCMIFQQTFTFLDGEKQEDREIRVIPCSVSSVSARNDYRPTPAEGGEAQRIIGRINEYSRDFGLEFDQEGYLKKQESGN